VSGLEAYNIGVIPIPWIACAGFIILAVACIISSDNLMPVPGMLIYFVFLGWVLVVNCFSIFRFQELLPAGTTLSYELFILVRFVKLITFGFIYYLVHWFLKEGQASILIKGVVWGGIIFAMIAFYVYLAHIYQLPDIPRTRLGTAGGQQATTFSTGKFFYSRAIGAFREPSHLAEWLLLPLCFSFLRSHYLYRLGSLIIALALLLTVSLAGILSLLLGLVVMIINNPLRRKNLAIIILALFALTAAALISKGIYVDTNNQQTTIYTIVSSRIVDLIHSGVQSSSRGYVYNFISKYPFPITGYGLGNVNILLSNSMGSSLIVSTLSLYYNILYSAGLVGFFLLSIFLLRPALHFMVRNWNSKSLRPSFLLMAYVAMLICFTVLTEELTIAFAISAGFLSYQGSMESCI
jgi:hypothetical protein